MKTQRIAVAIVHGIGKQEPEFAQPIEEKLHRLFAHHVAPYTDNPARELVGTGDHGQGDTEPIAVLDLRRG